MAPASLFGPTGPPECDWVLSGAINRTGSEGILTQRRKESQRSQGRGQKSEVRSQVRSIADAKWRSGG
jgi:hypothetical protein